MSGFIFLTAAEAAALDFSNVAYDADGSVSSVLPNGVSHVCYELSPVSDPFTPTAATLAPSFTALPAISGTATQGQTLTVSYTAAGNPTPSAVIEWRADGVPIAGQTAASLPLGAAEIGATITVNVALSNSEGSVNETSPGVGPVAAAATGGAFGGGFTFDATGLAAGPLRLETGWTVVAGGNDRVQVGGDFVSTTAVSTESLVAVDDLGEELQRIAWTAAGGPCFSWMVLRGVGLNNAMCARLNDIGGTITLQVRSRVSGGFTNLGTFTEKAPGVPFAPLDEIYFEADGLVWRVGTTSHGEIATGAIPAGLAAAGRIGVLAFSDDAQNIFQRLRVGDDAV